MNHPKNYLDYVKNTREPKDIGMTSAREIALGVNFKLELGAKRNSHLWCYRNDAIDRVEGWLTDLDVINNPNFQSFGSFEELYDYVESNICDYDGVGAVMVYDVALYLGERMKPQVVPLDYVYVHGRIIDAARHLFKLMSLTLREVMHGHRISMAYFEPLGIKSLDKQYAARAIEEWLCNEEKHIENANTLEELI